MTRRLEPLLGVEGDVAALRILLSRTTTPQDKERALRTTAAAYRSRLAEVLGDEEEVDDVKG
jgi:hypothetical protein